MDNIEETKPEYGQEEEVEALWISEDVRSYLYETSKWAKFLAVVGLIFSILTALTAFGAGAVMNSGAISANNPLMKLGAAGITVIYLLLAVLQFYPSMQLYKFATAANQAVLYTDQESLSAAMHKLKSFFKFWGIITIAFLALYLMTIVFMAVAGVAIAGR